MGHFGSQEGGPEVRSAEGLEASARAPARVLANHPQGHVVVWMRVLKARADDRSIYIYDIDIDRYRYRYIDI